MLSIQHSLYLAVVRDDGFVAEHDRRLDDGVTADVAVAAEDGALHAGFFADPGVGPDDGAADHGAFLDVRLPADDGIGQDARAGLDDRALVDEARSLHLDALVYLGVGGDPRQALSVERRS